MSTLTFTFTAKRDDSATDSRGDYSTWEVKPGYRIPMLEARHVSTPRVKWDTRATIMFGSSRASEEIREARQRRMLERAGLCTRYVFEGDDNVTIAPRGNGFMATITLTLELSA